MSVAKKTLGVEELFDRFFAAKSLLSMLIFEKIIIDKRRNYEKQKN